MASSNNCFSTAPRRPRLTPPNGFASFVDAHPFCKEENILTFHVFSRLSSADQMNVEQACKKWMVWCRRTRQFQLENLIFRQAAALKKWILDDIIYNDGRNLMVWLERHMTVYFDDFPVLFEDHPNA